MRRAAKVDANHGVIRRAYRDMGCTVWDTFQLGNGAPDLVVALFGINDLVEVKDGAKPPSERKLTPDEVKFHEAWNSKIWIIKNIDEVIFHVADMRKRWERM